MAIGPWEQPVDQPAQQPVVDIRWQLARDHAQQDKRRLELVKARMTAEKLRYNAYVRNGSLSDFMQRLGETGRKYWRGIKALRFLR